MAFFGFSTRYPRNAKNAKFTTGISRGFFWKSLFSAFWHFRGVGHFSGFLRVFSFSVFFSFFCVFVYFLSYLFTFKHDFFKYNVQCFITFIYFLTFNVTARDALRIALIFLEFLKALMFLFLLGSFLHSHFFSYLLSCY